MVHVRAFRALRPPAELALRVAALPYDVMSVAEARAMAADNADSFLHVSRPEIDLPVDADPYDEAVYEQGRANLADFVRRGVLRLDDQPTLSVYRQRMGDHEQTGIVAVAAVADYDSGAIAKHELTRPEKELDRVRHIDVLGAQDEPVFLLSERNDDVQSVMAEVSRRRPDVDLVTDDGIGHTLWVLADQAAIERVTKAFGTMPRLYVADGHHRSAAASRVRGLRHDRGEAAGAHDDFLVVIFAGDELQVLPYHRVVRDLAGLTGEDLLAQLGATFEVTPAAGAADPSERHVVSMYVAGQWHRLQLRAGQVDESDPVARLDVSVLQDLVLGPMLGISDPRTDPRLQFVGGIRGTEELQRLVDSDEAEVAFALHPTSVADLVALADRDLIMPPKSTWFEPKLRSGLFLHPL